VPGLRLAPDARRAAPGGATALTPAGRGTDARHEAVRAPGPPAHIAHHQQRPRPASCPQPARTELHGRGAGPRLARRFRIFRPTRTGSIWRRSRTWPRTRSSAGLGPIAHVRWEPATADHLRSELCHDALVIPSRIAADLVLSPWPMQAGHADMSNGSASMRPGVICPVVTPPWRGQRSGGPW
jgi:hypothetical protein